MFTRAGLVLRLSSARANTNNRHLRLSGDTKRNPPQSCTDPHSMHAFILSVLAASLAFRLSSALGPGLSFRSLEVGIRQPRANQSTLAFLS
jgi:hypothetical protein